MTGLFRKKTWQRMISVLAILVMLCSMMPVALADGGERSLANATRNVALGEAGSPESGTETSTSPEADVATPTPEPVVEATPTPELADPTAAPTASETPDPAVTPDPGLETPLPEETPTPEPSLSPSPSPLPYGFAGMPEGYILSEAELAAKAELNDKNTVASTEALTAGKDYVEDEVMFWSDSRDYAEMVAAAYSGELSSYTAHIAVIKLLTATVAQAISVAADMNLVMPAVEVNYIVRLDPMSDNLATKSKLDLTAQSDVPQMQTWYEKPNDPYLESPNSYDYQWVHDAVNTYEAWGVTTGSSSVKVAVIDTGVLAKHEDLAGKVTVVDMTDQTHDSNDDMDGHGTHVAGIIAATSDNGKGGAGIAPGVSILSLKVLLEDGGQDDWIAVAIGRAVEEGADIINMSLRSYHYSSVVNASIQDALSHGVTVIAAMGNDGSNSLCYPAAYDGVIAVAAVNSDFRRANFSNYGSWADIAAPGVDIMSTVKGENSDDISAYELMDGTSMAAPVVSGVAALYLSKNPDILPAALEKKLEASVTKSGSSSIGSGVIDAAKLFFGDRTPPTITIYNGLGVLITNFKLPVPQESTMTLQGAKGSTNAKMILYTTDGSTPAISNGEIKNGIEYTGAVNLSDLPAGKTITIKAICINGMGVASSVVSQTLSVSLSSTITEMTIDGVSQITAGGLATYKASVLPVSKVSQKVTWSISSRTDAAKATISSAGVLKTVANDGGWVTIRATSSVNTDWYVEKMVEVQAIPFVRSLTLDSKKLILGVGAAVPDSMSLTISSIINAANASVDPSTLLWDWSSSNTKVATVDSSGVVTAVGKGSATIKCMVLDGSKKYASCSVVVNQLVQSVTIAGQLSVASGKTATYKATVLPATATNKAVIWSLSSDAPAGVTISATSGVLKVPATVTAGAFTVQATSKDGTTISSGITVTITPMATSINLTSDDYNPIRVLRSRTGVVTGASILTRDMDETSDVDNLLQLGYVLTGNTTQPLWTSSSPAIASVDQSGLVTGLKAGSATITCATQDGSAKKATVKVTVNVPCSSITVSSSLATSGHPTIAFGKSAKNTVTFGDTYGKPTSNKVTWDYAVIQVEEDGTLDNVDYWTDYCMTYKRVTLSSSGTLSVSSALRSSWESLPENVGLIIVVSAMATDGSEVYGSIVYQLQSPTSYLVPDLSTYPAEAGKDYTLIFYASSYNNDFTVTSSNPKIAGVIDHVWDAYDEGGNLMRGVYLLDFYAGQPGTATLTIQANDGSGVRGTVTVKVK